MLHGLRPDAWGLHALRVQLADVLPSPSTPADGVLLRSVTFPGGSGPGRRGGNGDTSNEPEVTRICALVELARDGDAEAFGSLYDIYVDSVYRYVYYRVRSHQVAEDITSDTFVRALRAIERFTWRGRDIGAWFLTIARHLVADHVKSKRYQLEVTTDEIFDGGGDVNQPDDLVLRDLSNRRLLEAVKQLGPLQQECIVLRFLHDLSVAETAAVLGRKEGAVKTLQYRAVRALAALLEGEEL